MVETRQRLHETLLIGVFCGFFFFYGLSAVGLLGADEPRYAQVAREMLARGDWVTPTLWGKPWLEKPPLFYWGALISYWLLGVRDWAARVPSAALATLMVFGLYFFLRRFFRGAELGGAFIAASTVAILGFARGGETDMSLAACFTLAMLTWLAWHVNGEKRFLAEFYFFLAAAALAKGPVAPLLAGLIIVLFAVAQRELRIVARTLWWPGLLLFAAVAAPWYALAQARNPQFFNEFFLQHNVARFTTNLYRHPHPFWYYLPVLLLGLFPWTVFAVAGWLNAIQHWREPEDDIGCVPARKFLLIWALTPIIFFSFSQSKLPGYILPAIPAWILLATIYLQDRIDHVAPLRMWLGTLHALFVATVCGAVILAPRLMLLAYQVKPHLGDDFLISVPGNVVRTAAIVAALVFIFVLVLLRVGGWEMARLATLVPVILALAFVIKVAAPIVDATQSARPLAEQLGAYPKAPIAVLDLHRGTEYGLGFYRNRQMEAYRPGAGRRLLIAPMDSVSVPREKIFVGEYGPTRLGIWWVER